MRKIRIDPFDNYRALLTDVLPYETPLFFSNEGFYRFCRKGLDTAPPIIKTLLTGFEPNAKHQNPQGLNTVPYGYEIRKGTLGTRTLSLIHPAVQLQVVSLYSRFAHVILHLCKRSRFSLRYPESVASAVYGKPGDSDEQEETPQYGATYFKYEKYELLYRFFDSYEYQRLEKRFRHLRMFDISQCFNHIYTHTLSWAIKSKEFAKRHIRHRSFDADFDAIMQAANHKETAGILIGPEVSRIFAEIILQRVDAAVERRLAAHWEQGLDYDIRRYVDDYYVFSGTREIGDEVMSAYHQELKQYRLDFNDSKSTAMVVPFMTSISCAKVALNDIMNSFFDSITSKVSDAENGQDKSISLRPLWNPGRKANRLIQRIKVVNKTFDVQFASISGFLLSVIEKRLNRTLKCLSSKNTTDQNLMDFLFALIEMSFFIYAMDVRVSTTYKIGRIVIAACKSVENLSAEAEELIKKKIFDESRRILIAEIRGRPELYVETVNLLAVIRVLGPQYRVPAETIGMMMEGMDRESSDAELPGIDYFLVVALLFHMGNDSYYAQEKTNLLHKVRNLFAQADNPWQRADFLCLFLDLLRCPFLDPSFKTELTTNFRIRGKVLSRREKRSILDTAQSSQWFTDWEARDSIEVLLEKKRYRTPY